MAWIESHEEIWDHHKIIRLCAAVNQPDYAVVGRLMSLWHFTLRNAWKNANLEPWGDDGIERASRWDGEKGVWIRALRECGIIDNFIVHGFRERAGRLVNERFRNEKRRRSTGGRQAVSRRSICGKPAATVPYQTVPNRTKPNQTEPSKETEAAIPEDLKPNEIEIRDWLEYKRQRNQRYKPKGIEALWRCIRAIPPGKRKAAIEHSMANNWSGLFEKRDFSTGGNDANTRAKDVGFATATAGKYPD